jgi:phosphohistidine phosphatase
MKTLVIIRHAKSSWSNSDLNDHDRPIKGKGRDRTHKVAGYLKEHNIIPDLMVSSTAVRAVETASIIAQELNYPFENIVCEKAFYRANVSSITNYLFALNNDVETVFIFGHNPTFTHLSNNFVDNAIDWLSTTATVCIKFSTDKWEEIMLVNKKTNFVVFPKMF